MKALRANERSSIRGLPSAGDGPVSAPAAALAPAAAAPAGAQLKLILSSCVRFVKRNLCGTKKPYRLWTKKSISKRLGDAVQAYAFANASNISRFSARGAGEKKLGKSGNQKNRDF